LCTFFFLQDIFYFTSQTVYHFSTSRVGLAFARGNRCVEMKSDKRRKEETDSSAFPSSESDTEADRARRAMLASIVFDPVANAAANAMKTSSNGKNSKKESTSDNMASEGAKTHLHCKLTEALDHSIDFVTVSKDNIAKEIPESGIRLLARSKKHIVDVRDSQAVDEEKAERAKQKELSRKRKRALEASDSEDDADDRRKRLAAVTSVVSEELPMFSKK
jgi:hypothetical protein